MIYTSYFAKYKGTDGISIARYQPKWLQGRIKVYEPLAPNEQVLLDYKLTKAESLYKEKYLQQLAQLNPHKVASDLDGKVLLCYEKPGDVCHRHWVAEWLRSYGYSVAEWSGDDIV